MTGWALPSPLLLPVRHRLDAFTLALLRTQDTPPVDFTRPRGEEALAAPDSVSWRIFKNPVALFVGGVAAVILELAEPRVRAGVWEHSSFRTDPVRRLQRTGIAALVTVYGARSVAERMIAGIARLHAGIAGETSAGKSYSASDIDLLTWVHVTACFGFAQAYSCYVRPLSGEEFDRLCAEGVPAARLYGVLDAPASGAELHALFAAMRGQLQPSPVIFEFLDIVRGARLAPASLRPLQRLLVRAAVEMTPGWVRERLGLDARYGLRGWERPLIQRIGSLSDKVVLRSGPAAQSCSRLGLPEDYLYRR